MTKWTKSPGRAIQCQDDTHNENASQNPTRAHHARSSVSLHGSPKERCVSPLQPTLVFTSWRLGLHPGLRRLFVKFTRPSPHGRSSLPVQ